MSICKKDIGILRRLACKTTEIAALPVQAEKRKLWSDIGARRMTRPAVIVGDLPVNELKGSGELKLECEDEFARGVEFDLRLRLYRWKHFAADMVMNDYINLYLPVTDAVYGMEIKTDNVKTTDPDSDILSRHYVDQLQSEKDIEKITAGDPELDVLASEELEELYNLAFGGIISVKRRGARVYFNAWDNITAWHGVENTMTDLIDRPEFMHAVISRTADAALQLIDRLEKSKLLDEYNDDIMYTPVYDDFAPAGGPCTAKNAWTIGTAQLFGSVSKEMHEEFELPYANRVFDRFGKVYYGCCEPLHDRIGMVDKMKNVVKVSVSPWADVDIAAENIGKKYVYSRKPNPSYIAGGAADWNAVEKDLRKTLAACRRCGCITEFVLKDISTVSFKPERLTEWVNLAQRVVNE